MVNRGMGAEAPSVKLANMGGKTGRTYCMCTHLSFRKGKSFNVKPSGTCMRSWVLRLDIDLVISRRVVLSMCAGT